MNYYLFKSRLLTHVAFWICYYLLFGFIWARDGDYFSSYFLEFVLLPVRILATYVSLYWLVPRFLQENKYLNFAMGYLTLIGVAGFIQRIFTFYYYDYFLTSDATPLINLPAIGRNLILVNSTVLFVTALKVMKLWHLEKLANKQLRQVPSEPILEVKADKRIYRIRTDEIRYIESLGNYVTLHLNDRKLISYISLTELTASLPANFIRVHKSYLINKHFISSYNHEDVEVGNQKIPVGRAYKEQLVG